MLWDVTIGEPSRGGMFIEVTSVGALINVYTNSPNESLPENPYTEPSARLQEYFESQPFEAL